MTWGSNATGNVSRCTRCGGINVDDTDTGPSTHEQQCRRSVWRSGLIVGAFGLTFVALTVVLMHMVQQQDRADLEIYCKPRGYVGAGVDKVTGYHCLDANGNEVAITVPDWRRAVR